jgi:Fe/S biogenesis protein NfuA
VSAPQPYERGTKPCQKAILIQSYDARVKMKCMSSKPKSEEDLREEIGMFLQKNFPQIQMHGGSAAIDDLDLESGEVSIQLGGACSGCGISPMTIQAIKKRMTNEIAEIETVHANTGGGDGGDHGDMSPSFPGETTDEGDGSAEDDGAPTAPF